MSTPKMNRTAKVGLILAASMLAAVLAVNFSRAEARPLVDPRPAAKGQWKYGLTPDGRVRIEGVLYGQTVMFESTVPPVKTFDQSQ